MAGKHCHRYWVPTKGPLAQAQAGQVVGLGAELPVTQHQLPTVTTAEALIL